MECLFQNHSLVLGHTKKNCDAKNWKFRKLSELERETRLVRDTAAKSWKLRAGPLAPPYRGHGSAASTRAALTSWLKSYCRIFNKLEKFCKIISKIMPIIIFINYIHRLFLITFSSFNKKNCAFVNSSTVYQSFVIWNKICSKKFK